MKTSGKKLVFIFFVLNLLFVTKISHADSLKNEAALVVTSTQNQYTPSIVDIQNPVNLDEVVSVDLEAGFTKNNKLNSAASSTWNQKIYRQPDCFHFLYSPLIFDLPPPKK